MAGKLENYKNLYAYDAEIHNQYGLVCGVDEAGRGPLCGPVSVAAVILNYQNPIEGINDSKALNEKKREALYEQIIKNAVAYKVIFMSPSEIDHYNILGATMIGMKKSIEELETVPQVALIDGNKCPETAISCMPVIKGDAKSAAIAAASILAKVERDRYMKKLDEQYPDYRLAKHKGYPTKEHYAILDELGIQDFYRRSFLIKRGYVDEI